MYIDKLDDAVNKYNNTYHRMKPVDVKPSMYIDVNKQNRKEGSKIKVGNYVKISKYKNIFAKGYVPNWSEEVLVIKKVKSTVPWTYVISDLKGEEIVGTFYEKELQKANQKWFRVIKRKGNKSYVKWKGYGSSFNSWIVLNGTVQMSEYFPKPKSFGGSMKVELDLSN